MPTVTRRLPEQPHLDVPRRQARELLYAWRERIPEAVERIRHRHPKFQQRDGVADASALKLTDAQLVIAREYGFATWAALKQRIAAHRRARALQAALEEDDRAAVAALLAAHPELLHLPVRSGNWGPPMSHAANLGRLAIIQLCAQLGAKDFQHAFDRALLQGQIDCARWLRAHGAQLAPGIVLGTCETLNADGFAFLLEAGAPLTDRHGNVLAPLAMVLGTYARQPHGKHAILDHFVRRGYVLPDTPVMALHRGDIGRLQEHLRRDPLLLQRTFTLRKIYPEACGFARDGGQGLHWTPIDGTTLLHLAVDFHETEIVAWLLAQGADANARATVDAEGFGGHTPLFNAAVCGPCRDTTTVAALLKAGADPRLRANIRKFLDWREHPEWHLARDVTAAEWGRTFPEKSWVNQDALEQLGR